VPLQFRASYLQDPAFFVTDSGWRAKRSTGASGASGDIGSHVVDMAEYLCGDIVRVFACLRYREQDFSKGWCPEAALPTADAADDAAIWLAQFSNGAIGTFAVSFASYGRKNRLMFEIDCTRGAAEFNWNKREEIRVAYADTLPAHSGFNTIICSDLHPDVWYPVPGLGFGYIDGSVIQLRKYLEAILHGTTTQPDFAHAAHVQQVVDALYDSVGAESWVDVPAPLGGSNESQNLGCSPQEG
jgi:predicted dehydrogenase